MPGDGLFDATCEHCFVLCMKDKRDHVLKQLAEDNPHSRVTLQINVGYKVKFERDARLSNSTADIAHAYGNVFGYCLSKKMKRVMVLEDDFFVGEDRKKAAIAASPKIGAFLDKTVFDTYNIGRVAFVGYPSLLGSWRALWHGSSHAVIYSSRYMVSYVEQMRSDPTDIYNIGSDRWWNHKGMHHYVYSSPLVFQTFPASVNRELWDTWYSKLFINATGLDVSAHPGYDIMNFLCKMAFAATILLVLLVVIVPTSVSFHICRNRGTGS